MDIGGTDIKQSRCNTGVFQAGNWTLPFGCGILIIDEKMFCMDETKSLGLC